MTEKKKSIKKDFSDLDFENSRTNQKNFLKRKYYFQKKTIEDLKSEKEKLTEVLNSTEEDSFEHSKAKYDIYNLEQKFEKEKEKFDQIQKAWSNLNQLFELQNQKVEIKSKKENIKKTRVKFK